MFLEKQEVERIRSLTEEERRQELRSNPKVITNKAVKGKYKFLQKYYHRGAFYLDEEDNVFKQDFSGATLDDHFDKTVLPKVRLDIRKSINIILKFLKLLNAIFKFYMSLIYDFQT